MTVSFGAGWTTLWAWAKATVRTTTPAAGRTPTTCFDRGSRKVDSHGVQFSRTLRKQCRCKRCRCNQAGFRRLVRVQDELQKALGRRVRQLRLKKGYSQEAFADHCGVHRTFMGTIEARRDEFEPPKSRADRGGPRDHALEAVLRDRAAVRYTRRRRRIPGSQGARLDGTRPTNGITGATGSRIRATSNAKMYFIGLGESIPFQGIRKL